MRLGYCNSKHAGIPGFPLGQLHPSYSVPTKSTPTCRNIRIYRNFPKHVSLVGTALAHFRERCAPVSSQLGRVILAFFVNKMVPCAWLSSSALKVWSLRLFGYTSRYAHITLLNLLWALCIETPNTIPHARQRRLFHMSDVPDWVEDPGSILRFGSSFGALYWGLDLRRFSGDADSAPSESADSETVFLDETCARWLIWSVATDIFCYFKSLINQTLYYM